MSDTRGSSNGKDAVPTSTETQVRGLPPRSTPQEEVARWEREDRGRPDILGAALRTAAENRADAEASVAFEQAMCDAWGVDWESRLWKDRHMPDGGGVHMQVTTPHCGAWWKPYYADSPGVVVVGSKEGKPLGWTTTERISQAPRWGKVVPIPGEGTMKNRIVHVADLYPMETLFDVASL